MFDKVIVGVDGEEGGRDAIALAQLLVRNEGVLTLAYVYHGDPHLSRGTSPVYEASQHERSLELLGSIRDRAGADATLRCVGAASAGRGLHELAEEAEADLLVVGSSRRGVLGRVTLGDDTRAALNGAPCAVAIAPAGYAHEPHLMREIGIGYNGSAESEHALAMARALAAIHDAKLSAFEAVSLPAIGYTPAGGPAEELIEELVNSAKERVATLDGVEPHAAYGEAAEELAIYSASLDLLVLGSRDYGPLGRLVHGSTSQQLARNGRCPLLVITRAARAAHPDPEHETAAELAITPSLS